MKAIDMTKIYGSKNYKGKWVAIKNHETHPEVIASAKTLNEVLEKARQKGFDLPLVTQIPRKVLPLAGPYALK